MPRKATNKIDTVEEKVVKRVAKKETKKAVTKKEPAKKVASKSTETKATTKSSKASAPKTTKKSTSSKAKTTAKKTTKTVKKTTKSTTKKSTSKSTTKKSTSRAKKITASSNLTRKIEILEYYDLPYRYNQTIVKVLAQTPTTLFVYWDISDADRAHYLKTYGENFFNDTKPVLVIHNITMNYSYEIDIDDFANSWYLHVNDSNCEYSVELGRRPKYNNEEFNMPNSYLYVTSSNVMDSPNDHILFDKNLKTVYFRDVKTNIVTAKDITSISFLRNMGKIYSLYDLQGHFNEDVFINSNAWRFDLRNPSSSSTFK